MTGKIISCLAGAGRLDGSTAEAANRVWVVLRHNVVVHRNSFAVDGNLAGEAVANVEIAGGEYIIGADVWAGDWKSVQRVANYRMYADISNAAAESVVVVLAFFFGVAAAAVLHFPGASIAGASIKAVEQRNTGKQYARLAAHALWGAIGWASV